MSDEKRMTTKHTPGPWHVEEEREGVLNVCVRDIGTFCRPARVNGDASDDVYGPIIWANARLIAAAPELLDACINALHILGVAQDDRINLGGQDDAEAKSFQCDIDALRKAIAKAKGGAAL